MRQRTRRGNNANPTAPVRVQAVVMLDAQVPSLLQVRLGEPVKPATQVPVATAPRAPTGQLALLSLVSAGHGSFVQLLEMMLSLQVPSDWHRRRGAPFGRRPTHEPTPTLLAAVDGKLAEKVGSSLMAEQKI